MKNIIIIILMLNSLCFFTISKCTYRSNYVFGGEDLSEIKTSGMQRSFLLAQNNEEGGYIFEKDIIIRTDESDKKTIKKETVKKDKEITGKEKEEKTDSMKETADKIRGIYTEAKEKSYTIEMAYEYLKKGEKHEARNIFSALYFAETEQEKRSKIKTELDTLNGEIVFSMSPSPDAEIYYVKPGDTLSKIASEFNTTYELIMKVNNKNRQLIRVGERLKILNGEISLLVDKSDFTLTVLLNDRFIKQYPVGIGMFDKTPEDVFVVKDKLINPVWYSPEGVYEFGDPRNLLGTRWMGFEDKGNFYGYGIHGTNDPETVGKASSNGCIRLKNEDVEDLFNFVKIKTKVVIHK